MPKNGSAKAGSKAGSKKGAAAFEYDPVEGVAVLEPGLDEPTHDIANVEIFKAGDYGAKGVYTARELDEMVATFNWDSHRPPVTLDHARSGPCYGRVRKVWHDGNSLFADLSGVPESMRDAIQAGRYDDRSVETWRGEDGRMQLRRLTFLGAGIPHVKGMATISMSEPAEGVEVQTLAFSEAAPAPAPEAEDAPAQDTEPEAQDEEAPGPEPGDAPAQPEAAPASSKFGAPPESVPNSDPAPGDHGPLVREERVDSALGHCHFAFLDAAGNGLTGPPLGAYDWERERYGAAPVEPHFHIVQEFIVQPAEVRPGQFAHAHALSTFKETRSAGPEVPASSFNQGDDSMPDAKTPEAPTQAQTPAPATSPEVEALRKEVAALRHDSAMRVFSDEAPALVADGRLTPTERDSAKAFFAGLVRADSQATVRFSDEEGDLPLTKAFMSFLRGLAPRPALFKDISGQPAPAAAPDAPTGNPFKDDPLHQRTLKFQGENPGLTYKEALIKATAEARGGNAA